VLKQTSPSKIRDIQAFSVVSSIKKRKKEVAETFWPIKLKLLLFISIIMDLVQLGMTYFGLIILFIIILNS